jgi:hypothetical protein
MVAALRFVLPRISMSVFIYATRAAFATKHIFAVIEILSKTNINTHTLCTAPFLTGGFYCSFFLRNWITWSDLKRSHHLRTFSFTHVNWFWMSWFQWYVCYVISVAAHSKTAQRTCLWFAAGQSSDLCLNHSERAWGRNLITAVQMLCTYTFDFCSWL